MASTFVFDQPAVALAAATAKSVTILSAASTNPFKLIEYTVGCDATSSGTLKVELLVGTISGGTAGTAPGKARMNGEGYLKAPLTTATGGYTAEPSYTANANNSALAVKTMVVPLPSTPFDLQLPLGRELFVPESNVLAVRLTCSIVANAYVTLAIEE